ncbi:hypothetical protein B0H14DRAFT_2650205 [Mycena olivaceomarginata]|nr:hypothetical protein B0H14DRAFT_2650205 [Mycena olivaceomarginata]
MYPTSPPVHVFPSRSLRPLHSPPALFHGHEDYDGDVYQPLVFDNNPVVSSNELPALLWQTRGFRLWWRPYRYRRADLWIWHIDQLAWQSRVSSLVGWIKASDFSDKSVNFIFPSFPQYGSMKRDLTIEWYFSLYWVSALLPNLAPSTRAESLQNFFRDAVFTLWRERSPKSQNVTSLALALTRERPFDLHWVLELHAVQPTKQKAS